MTKIKSKKVKARPKIKSNKLEDFKPELYQKLYFLLLL